MRAIDEIISTQPEKHVSDDVKLREAVIYLSWACESDPFFGATKLNKLLFFADFKAYVDHGQSITGQEYRAREYGPVPVGLPAVRKALVEEGNLVIRHNDFFGKRQDQTIAMRSPNVDVFKPHEITILESTVREWWGTSGAEMSRASHRFVGWRLAEPEEAIPYETALFEPHEASAEDLRQAAELVQTATDCLSELSQ